MKSVIFLRLAVLLPYMIIQTDDLYESVKKHLQSEHDTLYVNTLQYDKLERKVSTPGLSTDTISSIRVFGLNVICINDLDYAILCRKGDVFPTAGDYK